ADGHARPLADDRDHRSDTPAPGLPLSYRNSSFEFRVHLTPRAAAERIDGVVEGELRVRVTAPPVDGAANVALERLLAAEIGVARSSVRVVAGASSRHKRVAVDGVAPDAVLLRWPGLR